MANKANKARVGLTPRQKDMLFMGLQLDDQFAALNTPLRTRKASLRITYVDHYPRLWVKTINSEPECVAYMNTRTKQMIPMRPTDENNLLFCNHLFASMGAVECIIAMSYDIEPKTQRKRLRLQLRSAHSASRSHTLHWVYKGHESPWLDEFVIVDHPLKPDDEPVPTQQVGGKRGAHIGVTAAQPTGGRSALETASV